VFTSVLWVALLVGYVTKVLDRGAEAPRDALEARRIAGTRGPAGDITAAVDNAERAAKAIVIERLDSYVQRNEAIAARVRQQVDSGVSAASTSNGGEPCPSKYTTACFASGPKRSLFVTSCGIIQYTTKNNQTQQRAFNARASGSSLSVSWTQDSPIVDPQPIEAIRVLNGPARFRCDLLDGRLRRRDERWVSATSTAAGYTRFE
jgi:hypothetical protein